MSLLLETIRITNGEVERFEYHQQRAKASARELYAVDLDFELEAIRFPEELRDGIVKCRVIYDTAIREITFEEYKMRELKSLKIVEDNTIDYSFKYLERGALNDLLHQKEGADEVLIVKNGEITEISYANIALRINEELFTPAHPLLKGTRRQSYLDQGVIKERVLTLADLDVAKELLVFNAMIGLDDRITIPIAEISR